MENLLMAVRVLVASCVLLYGSGFILMLTLWPVNDKPNSKTQNVVGISLTLIFIFITFGFLREWIQGGL